MNAPRPAFPLVFLFVLLGVSVRGAHGPELVVGGADTVLAPGPRYAPAAATNGDDDFVVWTDERGGSASIVGTRIRNGVVLDPLGIALERAAAAGTPRVASIGDSWLVTWNGSVEGVSRLRAARVSRDGQVITPAKTVIESAIGTDLAVIGSRAAAVFWQDDGIHAAILDADANVIARRQLATRIGVPANGIVAASATQFLIVWETHGTLEAVRVSANGALADPAPRTLGAGVTPALASDGTGFALVAFDRAADTWITRRIAPDLSSGPAHPLIASNALTSPLVIWTGSRYAAIALQERRQLYVAFLDADGASPPPRILPWPETSSYSMALSVVARRGELLITSIRELIAGDRIIVRSEFFDAATLAKQGPELALSWSGNEHSAPQAAFDGTNTLVVWRERDGVFATRVTPGGQSLDGRGIALAGPSYHWYLRNPRVGFDGVQYVVAWPDPYGEPGQIFVCFIDPATGAASDPLTIRSQASAVGLAVGRDATLLTWSDHRPMAARLDRASRSMSAPVALAPAGFLSSSATAAWNGREFLVAWNERVVAPRFYIPSLRIRGTRVTESLAILDADPLLLGDDIFQVEHTPVVASNGDEWLLVWVVEDFPAELRARRIAADGTGIGELFGLPLDLTSHLSASVLWDGSRYIVASATQEEIELLWLMPDLGFAGRSKVAASSQSTALVRTPDGVTAAYTRPIQEAPYAGVNRTVLRQINRPTKQRVTR